MYCLTILYGPPDDPDEFERYYEQHHIPLARTMPGFRRWTITRIEPAPDGAPPPYHSIVQLYADTRADVERALATGEARAASTDVANFATGGAVYLWGDEREVPFA